MFFNRNINSKKLLKSFTKNNFLFISILPVNYLVLKWYERYTSLLKKKKKIEIDTSDTFLLERLLSQ